MRWELRVNTRAERANYSEGNGGTVVLELRRDGPGDRIEGGWPDLSARGLLAETLANDGHPEPFLNSRQEWRRGFRPNPMGRTGFQSWRFTEAVRVEAGKNLSPSCSTTRQHSGHEVQPGRPKLECLARAVGQAALAVGADLAGERMALLGLVQPGVAAAAQRGRLKPVDHEPGSHQAAALLQRPVEAVLPLVAASFFSIADGATAPTFSEATRRRMSPQCSRLGSVPVHGFETPICAYAAMGIGAS